MPKGLGFEPSNYNIFVSCPKHPDRPCGPSSILHRGHSVAFSQG